MQHGRSRSARQAAGRSTTKEHQDVRHWALYNSRSPSVGVCDKLGRLCFVHNSSSRIYTATMSSTSLLRSSLPATSRSASSPRVSSPLATHSSSIDSQSDGDDGQDSESDAGSSTAGGSSSDEDSDAELGRWLAQAKENARQRAATLAANADSARAGPSIILEDADLLGADEE